MVSFGHAAYFALGAYAAALLVKKAGWPVLLGAAGGPGGGRGRRAALRLLHRAAQPHVLRDAVAGLRPDRLHRDLQVEGAHRRRRRPPGRVAADDAQVAQSPTTTSPSAWWPSRCGRSPPSSTRRSATPSRRCARIRGGRASSAINVRRHQLVAFVISGAFSGLAGGLFAFYNGSVFPDFAYFTKSFEPLVVACSAACSPSSGRWPAPSRSRCWSG